MKKLRLVFTFYKAWLIASWIITGSCMMIVYTSGIRTFTALFWFKVITLGIIYFLVNEYKRDELYYFLNLGLSKKILWIVSIVIDFTLYILSIIFMLYLR